jgi:hypothetical protein
MLGVALAAFCVWLGVRIFNRREKWAKRMAVGLVALLVAYPLSIGPVGWINSRLQWPGLNDAYGVIYIPLIIVYFNCPQPLQDSMDWYAGLWGLENRAKTGEPHNLSP